MPGNVDDVGVEVSAGCGPAGASAGLVLNNCGEFKFNPKGQLGPLTFEPNTIGAAAGADQVFTPDDRSFFQTRPDNGGGGKGGFKGCKIQGKLYGKVCRQYP